MKANLVISVLAISLLGGGSIAHAGWLSQPNEPFSSQPQEPISHDDLTNGNGVNDSGSTDLQTLLPQPATGSDLGQAGFNSIAGTGDYPTYPVQEELVLEFFACRGTVTIFNDSQQLFQTIEFWGKGSTPEEANLNANPIIPEYGNLVIPVPLQDQIASACESATNKLGNGISPFGIYSGYCEKHSVYQSGNSSYTLVAPTDATSAKFSCGVQD